MREGALQWCKLVPRVSHLHCQAEETAQSEAHAPRRSSRTLDNDDISVMKPSHHRTSQGQRTAAQACLREPGLTDA